MLKESILIISNYRDEVTNGVVDWIHHFGFKFIVSSFDNLIENYSIDKRLNGGENKLVVADGQGKEIVVNTGWYRRDVKERGKDVLEQFEVWDDAKKAMEYHWQAERECVKKSLLRVSENMKWLSEYSTKTIDKFEVLLQAKDFGLVIPKTLVTNAKASLSTFVAACETVICKSLHEENLTLFFKEKILTQYVVVLTAKDLENISSKFYPTFFQEKIEKEFEIRTFYLNGKCYSMAVFDASGNVDVKKQYSAHRNVPFQLPKEIENKIDQLMRYFKLSTGSLDFLKKKNSDDFYFLEINPIGQFNNVSASCNYYLEKEVAKFLCYGNE